jgi:hypothetical protein
MFVSATEGRARAETKHTADAKWMIQTRPGGPDPDCQIEPLFFNQSAADLKNKWQQADTNFHFMSKYVGIMPVIGTIGNITFSRGANGDIIAKTKSAVSREKILHDPAFARTREIMSEFTRAGHASRFVLETFREAVKSKPDRFIFARLQKLMMSIIDSDQSHALGLRTVEDGDLNLMDGFEFNADALMASTFWGTPTGAIDRTTGALTVTIPPYDPSEMVRMPEGGTHYRLVAAGIELDLEGTQYIRDIANSAWLVPTMTPTSTLTLTCNLTPASTLPLFLMFGVEYAKEKAGVKYPLKNGKFNPVAIIGTDA